MFSKHDLRQPMIKEFEVRSRDYLCCPSFRNVNCANWSNSCIGDRTIVYFAENDRKL